MRPNWNSVKVSQPVPYAHADFFRSALPIPNTAKPGWKNGKEILEKDKCHPLGCLRPRCWAAQSVPMPSPEEKTAFAERLKFAMKSAPEKLRSSTDLAMHFNLRYRGAQPVSPQAVQKWLGGRAIPKVDKLRTLAQWFHVDLHWLHYGPPPVNVPSPPPMPLPSDKTWPLAVETLELASKIESLAPLHRYLVQELVEQFYGRELL